MVLAKCIFKFEDIDEEGNTFASLLKTQALVRSLIKSSSSRNLFKLNVLAGMECELELHFVEFTQVIHRVCEVFVPHVLCEYLCYLSKLFKRCYRKVWQVSRGENMLGLCEATEVVMNKCFQLLGIAPSSDEWTTEFKSFSMCSPTFPSSIYARNEHPNSRFEIFSLNLSVAHSQFNEGSVTGHVTFVDKCRLADGDGWVSLDKKDDCHVSVFDREWFDGFPIYNGSYIPLGNTSCVRSVPFSSSIEVALLIKATSKNKDQTYLIYNGSGGADLAKFWEDGKLKAKCGSIEFIGKDGRILLSFVAIKDAVDTTMQLMFEPFKPLRLSGSIHASYGKDTLGDSGFFGEYTAHIFRADPSQRISCGKLYSLPLYKFALAVPANECLRMKANLVDVETDTCIVDDEVELCKSGSVDGVSTWNISCNIGFLELRVNWVH